MVYRRKVCPGQGRVSVCVCAARWFMVTWAEPRAERGHLSTWRGERSRESSQRWSWTCDWRGDRRSVPLWTPGVSLRGYHCEDRTHTSCETWTPPAKTAWARGSSDGWGYARWPLDGHGEAPPIGGRPRGWEELVREDALSEQSHRPPPSHHFCFGHTSPAYKLPSGLPAFIPSCPE